VARGVDDVDRRPAVQHRGVLGQDRDALFPLQVTGVHDPLSDLGADPERTGLPEHGVHQRGLPMVDVGHDGDVPQILASG
jgi:hypothetical protein